MTEKQKLHAYCKQIVQARSEEVRAEIKKIQQAANEETKSSAGDKYETGRAMAQLEIERSLAQLHEIEKLVTALQNTNTEATGSSIRSGAMVVTSKNTFYISISLGAIQFNMKNYFVVSPNSPIAKLLIGKQQGDSISWNGVSQVIQLIE